MKYLFFDIECAGVSKNAAKICAFGYCLTDEKFHILEKQDLLINPQGKFHLTDPKGRQGIVLPYEYDAFKNYPTFVEVEPKIRALLETKDTVVAGHATQNDVKYLNLEAKRFSLPSFQFSFADTQFVYMNKIGEFSRQFGLGKIAEELGVEFVPHRAVDDAYATMKIAEAMCKEENCSLVELFEKYSITLGRIKNYEVTQNTSVAQEKYLAEVKRKKEERERVRVAFHNFIDREKRKRKKDGKLKGKRICFSHALVLELDKAKMLAQKMFEQGGFYAFHAEECDVYVYLDGENGQRLKSAEANKARLLRAEEFQEYLEK